MSEKRFKQFGLWIIDDPNSNVNSIADLIDTKLMSTNEVVDLLNGQQATIEQLQKKLSECQGHKLELTPIPISRPITLKEAEDSIRVTKYEELFDDE